MYLEDGWLEFLRDACLGDKEFLVFIYTGKMHFSVKVFNKNGCERMEFPDIERHQNTTSSGNARRPRGRPRKSSIGNSGMSVCGKFAVYIIITGSYTTRDMFLMLYYVCEADKLKEVKEKQVDYINNSERASSKSTEMPPGSPTKPTSKCSKRSAVRQIESTSKRPRGRPRKYPETLKDSGN